MGRLSKCSVNRNPHIIKIRRYLVFKAGPVHSGCPHIYGGSHKYLHIISLIFMFTISLNCFFLLLHIHVF